MDTWIETRDANGRKRMKRVKKQLLAKVGSLCELENLARTNPQYAQLALIAAENLGGDLRSTLERAMQWLRTNAMETTEEGVVDEVNFCRDLVKDK